MRWEAVVAVSFACLASCGAPVPSTEGDGGPGEDVLPPVGITVGFTAASSIGDESSGTVAIPVSLSGPSSETVTVAFRFAGGSAIRLDDYDVTSPSEILTFPPGEVMQHIELAIVDDMIAEPDEDVVIELASPAGAMLGTSAHTLTISANTLPRVGVVMSNAQDTEDSTANVVFTLDTPASTDVSVDFALGGTATAADHGLVAGTVTFPAGSTQQVRELAVVDDDLDEDDETVEVTLTNPVGAMLATTAPTIYTILDDDAEPVVTFDTGDQTVAETPTTVSFEVRLSAVSGRTVTVPFAVDPGSTASAGADYTIPSSSLTFPAGTQRQPIRITIVPDTMPEYAETVTLALGTPTNAILDDAASRTRTLTISNDDAWCGGDGAFKVCYPELPTSARTLPASISTDSSSLCQDDQPTRWSVQGQPAACVVIGTDITISNTTTVTGARPLVLFASNNLTISANGGLDVTTNSVYGPAFPGALCNSPTGIPRDGGGGAGGSFITLGGMGGWGPGLAVGGRPGANVTSPPTKLRAGCNGQRGDGNFAGGRSGGSLYLIAGNTLTIHGAINASGVAGQGGRERTGGNGGGSGGMIVLHASAIDANGGTVMANGGGGSGGATDDSFGAAGSSPSVDTPTVPAPGGPGPGGDGGTGFAIGSPAGKGGDASAANTAGGGGGGGGGYIKANLALTGAQVSAGLVEAP